MNLTIEQINDLIVNLEDTKQNLEHKLEKTVAKISEEITKVDRLLEAMRAFRQSQPTE